VKHFIHPQIIYTKNKYERPLMCRTNHQIHMQYPSFTITDHNKPKLYHIIYVMAERNQSLRKNLVSITEPKAPSGSSPLCPKPSASQTPASPSESSLSQHPGNLTINKMNWLWCCLMSNGIVIAPAAVLIRN